MSDWQPPMPPASIERSSRSPRIRTTIAVACELLVVVFFVMTLHSVSTDDIDGLNFLPNVLLCLPWNLVLAPLTWVLGIEGNVYVQATIDFLAASFNVLLLWLCLRRSARRSVAR